MAFVHFKRKYTNWKGPQKQSSYSVMSFPITPYSLVDMGNMASLPVRAMFTLVPVLVMLHCLSNEKEEATNRKFNIANQGFQVKYK